MANFSTWIFRSFFEYSYLSTSLHVYDKKEPARAAYRLHLLLENTRKEILKIRKCCSFIVIWLNKAARFLIIYRTLPNSTLFYPQSFNTALSFNEIYEIFPKFFLETIILPDGATLLDFTFLLYCWKVSFCSKNLFPCCV